ncbi:glycoside hydrolase family 1 protein [Oidiodendron maius Zn]|uniref:Glycoside hydrolase family 1 protein n=1 Tax=Oidiodendron maius (strain Zn) TaxID=913774 RepID=A0A0C3HVQ2_OIDMZ|nr:glycoside hydrolase family 1 protein [Oidiodendron maius Zn]
MKLSSWIALLLSPSISLAADPNATGSVIVQENATTTASNGSSVANPSAFATTISIDLKQYWDLFVGPVQTATINTTVEPTPVPTSELIPPPPLYYAPFPTGHQSALVTKNESWKFPHGFYWGVASAAYQVEGAAQAEGRGPSIWDVFTHRATYLTLTNDTGDVGDNHYYLYKQDIARIAALGVPAYSISISWSRIFPYGRGQVNELALAHYDDVINTCIQYGVKPLVTLYHWDLPLYLQNLYGGWLSEEIVDDFAAYATVIFQRYGNKVSHWFTINEPIVFCSEYPLPEGYFADVTIPQKHQQYYCGHHAILAHAKAYHIAKSLGIKGTVAFKNNGGYKIPLTNSSEDALATQRAWDFNEGWFSNPVYVDGDYPSTFKTWASSIGLEFTQQEKSMINGTADIYAHDAYTSSFYYAPEVGVSACVSDPTNTLYPGCFNSSNIGPTGWLIGAASDQYSTWLQSATDWVPAFLHYIQETWPSGGIVVSEFGFSEPYEELRTSLADIVIDPIRSMYYRDYMQAILIAISEGVNVVGCIAWAIMDNLEWSSGYNTRFGLQYVNYTSFERSYKASFFEYVNAFKVYAEDPVVPIFVPGK